MKKIVVLVVTLAVTLGGVYLFGVSSKAAAWVTDNFFSRGGLINWVLLTSCLFCLFSATVFVFVVRNQWRRVGRTAVGLILSKKSYGGSVAARTCGDKILDCIVYDDYSRLDSVDVARLVVDHLVDHGFNVKLFNYMKFRIEKDEIKITSEHFESLIAGIERWKSRSESVSSELDEFIRNYAGVERAQQFKRAAYFLDRRKKYFIGICDEFVVDVKNATISVLSRRLT